MFDAGLDVSRHALHEHHQMDELVEKLQEGEPGDRGWMATAKALSHKVHHHLREEEKKFFQVSGKILGTREKVSLAKKYRKDFARMQKIAARGLSRSVQAGRHAEPALPRQQQRAATDDVDQQLVALDQADARGRAGQLAPGL